MSIFFGHFDVPNHWNCRCKLVGGGHSGKTLSDRAESVTVCVFAWMRALNFKQSMN